MHIPSILSRYWRRLSGEIPSSKRDYLHGLCAHASITVLITSKSCQRDSASHNKHDMICALNAVSELSTWATSFVIAKVGVTRPEVWVVFRSKMAVAAPKIVVL